MSKRAKLVCACGGEVPRPLPPSCPHCGKPISGVRRPVWSLVWPLAVIILLFAVLVGYLWWLLGGGQ
jgi:hypothetical protein